MRISLITREIQPFHQGPWSRHATALCAALTAAGHELLVVTALPPGCDPSQHGLARRLQPFELVRGSQTVPIVRYEGRLSCGAKATVLSLEHSQGSSEVARWLPAAAAQWVQAESEDATTWHLAAGPDAPQTAAGLLAGGLERVGIILDDSQVPEWPASRDAMSRVRWIALGTEDGLLPKSGAFVQALGPASLFERVHAFAMPCALDYTVETTATDDRAKNKASFQLQLGLPVSASTPLLLCETASTDLALDGLRSALRHGIQVICNDRRMTPALAQLLELYPDRLTVPSSAGPRGQLLRRVDACLAFDDIELAYEAASHGALPIVSLEAAGVFTDLGSDMTSGAAVIASATDSSSFDSALSRFAAMIPAQRSFAMLSARLPGYVPTWARTASHLAELMVD